MIAEYELMTLLLYSILYDVTAFWLVRLKAFFIICR
jgi:hypothetical protein